jgi:hypothetical protein
MVARSFTEVFPHAMRMRLGNILQIVEEVAPGPATF